MDMDSVFNMEDYQSPPNNWPLASLYLPSHNAQYFDWDESLELTGETGAGRAGSMLHLIPPTSEDCNANISKYLSELGCTPSITPNRLNWFHELTLVQPVEPESMQEQFWQGEGKKLHHISPQVSLPSSRRNSSGSSIRNPSPTATDTNTTTTTVAIDTNIAAASSSTAHYSRRSARLSQRKRRSNNDGLQGNQLTKPTVSRPGRSTTTSSSKSATSSPIEGFVPIEFAVGPRVGRVPHKTIEKKYREGMKAMFERLHRAVPVVKNYNKISQYDGDDGKDDNGDNNEFVSADGMSSAASGSPARLTKADIIAVTAQPPQGWGTTG
ncbi:hypothetical protein B0J12DRAFT_328985 [Macrophomina phaseolina]|uniref:BHLH domain-containing protein n=1 Tax=Macrophomina phaseolina TaxID=35725 RepID=A0ABQ8FUZ9_9PEZI|nr:hypothetical protein B0J12DRAFT_328985 [Macrophomina phaseolina]